MANIKAKKDKVSSQRKVSKKGPKNPKAVGTKAPKKGSLVIKEPFNNSLLIRTLAERTNLGKQEVLSVLEGLKEIIVAHLSKKGPQIFKLKGVFMAKIKDKPATKARKGINPFNGEEMIFAAKPARRTVKITALKKFKDLL